MKTVVRWYGALSDEQLCYVNDEYYQDDVLPLKVVTIKAARNQIKKTVANRKAWGYGITKYKLIPVAVRVGGMRE